ncbi:MAG TPA: hypothetical protein VL442_18840 [Mucilaginibacter sp.]|nr:hypothetical protein [Mucilaginibacter sp.]
MNQSYKLSMSHVLLARSLLRSTTLSTASGKEGIVILLHPLYGLPKRGSNSVAHSGESTRGND